MTDNFDPIMPLTFIYKQREERRSRVVVDNTALFCVYIDMRLGSIKTGAREQRAYEEWRKRTSY